MFSSIRHSRCDGVSILGRISAVVKLTRFAEPRGADIIHTHASRDQASRRTGRFSRQCSSPGPRLWRPGVLFLNGAILINRMAIEPAAAFPCHGHIFKLR